MKKQFTEEFNPMGSHGRQAYIAGSINAFMADWIELNDGKELRIDGIYTVYKFYPGDGKSVPFALVVFEYDD